MNINCITFKRKLLLFSLVQFSFISLVVLHVLRRIVWTLRRDWDVRRNISRLICLRMSANLFGRLSTLWWKVPARIM